MSSSGLRVRPTLNTSAFSYVPPLTHAPAPVPAPATTPGAHRCAPGPWGDIEYYFVHLEAADHLIAHYQMPGTTPRWCFPGATRETLAALLDAAHVPADWADRWLSPACLIESPGALHILPPVEHLESLNAGTRALIYRELARHEQNEFQRDPVIISSGDPAEWLRTVDIAPEHKRWLATMCYRRSSVLCFSDVPALLRRARTDTEALRFFKLCSRTRAVFARLNVTPQTDFGPLLEYWSARRRLKDVATMLTSAAEARCGIDLIHLLPPFARKLLNSYPPLSLAVHGRMPDCHWSSLNFFNYEPRHYYLDSRLASQHVLENYAPVEPPYHYGDVIFFLKQPGDQAVHSCVHIADDLVFSKNGDNAANPWVLTRLGDIRQVYLTAPGDRVQAWRVKG